MEQEEAKRAQAMNRRTEKPMRSSTDSGSRPGARASLKPSSMRSSEIVLESRPQRKQWSSLPSADQLPAKSAVRARLSDHDGSSEEWGQRERKDRESTKSRDQQRHRKDSYAEDVEDGEETKAALKPSRGFMSTPMTKDHDVHKKLTRSELKAARKAATKDGAVTVATGKSESVGARRVIEPTRDESEDDEEQKLKRKAKKKKRRAERRGANDSSSADHGDGSYDQLSLVQRQREAEERRRYDEENAERLEDLRTELRRLQDEEDEDEGAWATRDQEAFAKRRAEWAESDAREREWAQLDTTRERKRNVQRKAAADEISRLESDEGKEKAKLARLEDELRKLQLASNDEEENAENVGKESDVAPPQREETVTDLPIANKKPSTSSSVLVRSRPLSCCALGEANPMLTNAGAAGHVGTIHVLPGAQRARDGLQRAQEAHQESRARGTRLDVNALADGVAVALFGISCLFSLSLSLSRWPPSTRLRRRPRRRKRLPRRRWTPRHPPLLLGAGPPQLYGSTAESL
jgi:hypothetical protein